MGATQIGQLLRVPMMVAHFNKHSQETPDMSFVDFLKIHYGKVQPHDDDYEHDMSLPFKSLPQQSVLFVDFHTPPAHLDVATVAVLGENKSFKFFTPSPAVLSMSYDIFQPPKI